MKILITSDNHLGFKETDSIRAEDSFVTFKEILELATKNNVDLVLQGGDLFHENKPTRNTFNKTIQLLKEYCVGEKKVTFVCDTLLNFNNENMNISLPILSIHGNHDDPSGFNSISPLNVLHSGGFINYFGRVDDVDNIEIRPILIREPIKIAIYGLGHVKDRRLFKTFTRSQVKYIRPSEEGWYNILMVHQNRVPRDGEYLSEDLLPSFFDLVIYGHEHESIKIRHKKFDVIQVGSSIRTSLCEGEIHDKYAYLLDFNDSVLIKRFKLETVRPLIMDTIRITSGDVENQVKARVEAMIQQAKMSGSEMLPLLRLRIELNGNPDFNKHRLFAYMEGKVSNTSDSFRIMRKHEKQIVEKKQAVEKTDIEEIYLSSLKNINLKVLMETKIIESLKDFVDKDIKESFINLVKDNIEAILNNIDLDNVAGEDLCDIIQNSRIELLKKDLVDISIQENHSDSSNIIEFDSYDYKNALISSNNIEYIPKTVPLPKESSGLDSNISKINSSNSKDFTFVEDKEENDKVAKMINKLEIDKNLSSKRSKSDNFDSSHDSDDDLLLF